MWKGGIGFPKYSQDNHGHEAREGMTGIAGGFEEILDTTARAFVRALSVGGDYQS